MNEWSSAIWASLSAMTAALVLTLIFTLGTLTRESAHIQQEQDNAIAILKEYRKYSPYDGAENLLPQDVVAAIAESRGLPEIEVDTLLKDGTSYSWEWTEASKKEEFSISDLLAKFAVIPASVRYSSDLNKNLNGAITSIKFEGDESDGG